MSNPDRAFHEVWLGMVQPAEGLVVSPAVLLRAQCSERRAKSVQLRLRELCDGVDDGSSGAPRVRSLRELFSELLDLTPELFDWEGALPRSLALYVREGRQQQTVRPTGALRREGVAPRASNDVSADGEDEAPPESTPAGTAGSRYLMLVWEVPAGLDLDTAEEQTGSWLESPAVKFDRLLRECRVPIGLLSNAAELRLVYAPADGASGHIPFRVADMLQGDGRVILDAFVTLLEARRWFGVRDEDRLPSILVESRQRQAEVTTDLARQVFEALEILLAGFQAAADRDGDGRLYKTLETDEDRVYAGLLTLLLRVVFLLYCEDHRLMPMEHPLFSEHYSLFGLFDQLQQDNDRTPDSMDQRFGAYGRLIALFRLIYLGGQHRRFGLPERRGELFDPSEYPFLEGWGPGGSAPIACAERRREVRLPSVADGTVYRVLEKLIVLDGQRLSYRSLRVEQIGSVYEALMGFGVKRLSSDAVRLKVGSGSTKLWLEVEPLLATPAAQRQRWLKDELGFDNSQARRIADAVRGARGPDAALDKLAELGGKSAERAAAGTLVLQPSLERRRTSSHYTPPELARSVVERALEPLIKTMGPEPKSSSLLNLVVCDPAMGTGPFVVAACEYLARQLVAAWAREGHEGPAASADEDTYLHAKRLIAQRCLIGVDKNRYAVQLARMSLWLVTLSRHEPFTFVDHALRHGDSLVGLSLEQIRAFHWRPQAQLTFMEQPLRLAIEEALDKRRHILELAKRPGTGTREKEKLLFQARDALSDVVLVADVLLGAFFAHERDSDRETERQRRQVVVEQWLAARATNALDAATGSAGEDEEPLLRERLREWQSELRVAQVPFHWMVELPEVFCDERRDPLDGDRPNRAAWVDAFVGNPPFVRGSGVSAQFGNAYRDWLPTLHDGAHGNSDLCAHFFRRGHALLGSNGTIGLIATNTIGQGDTRQTGLQHLVDHGFVIYSAVRDLSWSGGAAVTVALCHLAVGTPTRALNAPMLDGNPVAVLDSRLASTQERADPKRLAANSGLSFLGSKTYGRGFELQPHERDELIKRNPSNAERVFPYLGGEEVNTSPTQSHSRYVISFGSMTLEEAGRWLDLLAIVCDKLPRERARLRDNPDGVRTKTFWWQYQRPREELYAAIASLQRCLVTSTHSKHSIFSFQPSNRVFSHGLYVFAFDTHTQFTLLQSRIHEPWARMLSGALRTDLRYSASDCFQTFPFPHPDPRTIIPALERIGKELYETRAKYMVDTDQGLTKTYNKLKDPRCDEPRIVELRRMHEALDRAVLEAYGWDIPVPPYYSPKDEQEQAALEAFKQAVIDRLYALNAERAAAEATSSPSHAPSRPGRRRATQNASPAEDHPPRPIANARSRRTSSSDEQPARRARKKASARPSEPPPTPRTARSRRRGAT